MSRFSLKAANTRQDFYFRPVRAADNLLNVLNTTLPTSGVLVSASSLKRLLSSIDDNLHIQNRKIEFIHWQDSLVYIGDEAKIYAQDLIMIWLLDRLIGSKASQPRWVILCQSQFNMFCLKLYTAQKLSSRPF